MGLFVSFGILGSIDAFTDMEICDAVGGNGGFGLSALLASSINFALLSLFESL